MLGTTMTLTSSWKIDRYQRNSLERPFIFKRFTFKRIAAIAAMTGAIVLGLIPPVLAGDPFRSDNSHSIDTQTEAAFRAIFEQGNYRQAAQLLRSPSENEPLAYAMRASLAYLSEDQDALGENATLTREAGERLVESDPLRGHLYTAVGHFLEGSHTVLTQGSVRATPAVLGKLQQVFENLRQAEAIEPNDPELNLLKGYMDLMLAVNLPFSNPQQAIDRLEAHAAPDYLAQRGIAIGYRDLDQQDQAIAAVDRALEVTPNNPDLFYLKAQILVRQDKHRESLRLFQQALAQQNQLFPSQTIQISFEACRAHNRATGRQRNCDAARDTARDAARNAPAI
jgi:tetratricopeptide (TPR) repeat protein